MKKYSVNPRDLKADTKFYAWILKKFYEWRVNKIGFSGSMKAFADYLGVPRSSVVFLAARSALCERL